MTFSDIPIVLGPTGTIVVGAIIIGQAVLNAYSWRKSTQAANLKGAVDAMKEELNIYRDKTTRLEKDVEEIKVDEAECRRQLERVTKWYLEAKGEEEERERARKTV